MQNLPRAPPRGGGNFLKNSKNREILEKPADEKRIQWGNFSKNIFARGEIFGFLEDSAPLLYTNGSNWQGISKSVGAAVSLICTSTQYFSKSDIYLIS